MRATEYFKWQDEDTFFKKAIVFSILSHVFLFLFFTVKTVFFSGDPIIYENAVRVDLVALPDKMSPSEQKEMLEATKKAVEEDKKKEIEQPEPIIEKSKKEKKIDDSINLDKKTKQKESDAFRKLKEKMAFEKLKKLAEQKAREKSAAKFFKGNQLSNGSDLKGLVKLEHENYISDVKQHIYQNWALPQWLSKKELSAQVIVKFDEQGNLIFKKLYKSSGNPSFDEAVLNTIEKSTPVPKPPDNLSSLIKAEGILIGFPE